MQQRRTLIAWYALAIAAFALAYSPPLGDSHPAAMFTDVTGIAGVGHVHHKPVFDVRLANVMPWITSMNAGAAAVDYNNDGLVDLYVVNSRKGFPNSLYRNDGNFHFTDVAAQVGLAWVNDGNCVSVDPVFGDLDNDGDQDLFLACYGQNKLYRNDGGQFTDITAMSGISGWSNASAAILVDYNNDGLLDIVLVHYFPRNVDLWQVTSTKILPDTFTKARNGGGVQLYRNDGHMHFTDVTEQAGLASSGWGLDVGAGDINDDGFPDLYIANDYGEDELFLNNGNGKFTNITRQATGGDFAAGMNVDFGDYDNDGLLDIYVTNITNAAFRQGNMLWKNMGDGTFANVADDTNSASGGWGWGAKFFDFDNDGDLDIFEVSGFVTDGAVDLFGDPRFRRFLEQLSTIDISDARTWPDMRGVSISGHEHYHLFENRDGMFRDIAEAAGVAKMADGRGVVIADFNNDGALDVYVTNCGGAAVMFRNNVGARQHWLELRLIGVRSNRDAIGARVVATSGAKRQIREVDGGNGFSSQSSRIVHFGLGASTSAASIEIQWPSGIRQVLHDVAANQRLVVREAVTTVPETAGR